METKIKVRERVKFRFMGKVLSGVVEEIEYTAKITAEKSEISNVKYRVKSNNWSYVMNERMVEKEEKTK